MTDHPYLSKASDGIAIDVGELNAAIGRTRKNQSPFITLKNFNGTDEINMLLELTANIYTHQRHIHIKIV